jgi:beta-glucosidase
LRATFRDAEASTVYATTLATGAGRWLQMPAGVDPEALASVEISGRLTAEVGGEHQLGIRGLGQFTLIADGQTLFSGTVEPDSDDLATLWLAPPQHRVGLRLTAGQVADVALTQLVSLAPNAASVSMSLGYSPPIVAADQLLAEAEEAAKAADVAIVVVGTTDEVESEGFDRTTLALPGRQDDLVRRVSAANPRTVVVVNAGSPVELPWADDVAAVLLAWFPGQEAGHALAEVLLGTAEPGGRLPTTWPVAEADCPVLSTTPTAGVLAYDEGVFIGYRAWERQTIRPRYPFGHGLSYTTWAYEQITVESRRVTVVVRNTGRRHGREVVQVYAGPRELDDSRPRRWLVGFAGATAAPGETATITIEVPERAFQIWADAWTTIAGEYIIEAAHSRGDIRLTATATVP